MGLLAAIAVLLGVCSLVTNALCRRALARARLPSAYTAVIGALLTAFVMALIFYGRDLFTRRFWDDGKAPALLLVPMFFAACTIIGLVPSTALVMFYQRRAKRLRTAIRVTS